MSSASEESFGNEAGMSDSSSTNETKRHCDMRTGGAPCDSLQNEVLAPRAIDDEELERHGLFSELSRRRFIQGSSAAAAAFAFGVPAFGELGTGEHESGAVLPITLKVNGSTQELHLDPRTSLLDALREHLDLTGTKKGCDHGQCGACTVMVDGRRVNSCLTLACAAEGAEITTVEGLAKSADPKTIEELSPVQAAFLMHDGYQCGYCTPGQIISATALLHEQQRGDLSIVSWQSGHTAQPELSEDEIRERMSGNICRCGAYPNIVAAVRAAAKGVSA